MHKRKIHNTNHHKISIPAQRDARAKQSRADQSKEKKAVACMRKRLMRGGRGSVNSRAIGTVKLNGKLTQARINQSMQTTESTNTGSVVSKSSPRKRKKNSPPNYGLMWPTEISFHASSTNLLGYYCLWSATNTRATASCSRRLRGLRARMCSLAFSVVVRSARPASGDLFSHNSKHGITELRPERMKLMHDCLNGRSSGGSSSSSMGSKVAWILNATHIQVSGSYRCPSNSSRSETSISVVVIRSLKPPWTTRMVI